MRISAGVTLYFIANKRLGLEDWRMNLTCDSNSFEFGCFDPQGALSIPFKLGLTRLHLMFT